MRPLLAWLIALTIYLLRFTCRIKVYNDSRTQLRADRTPYAYAVLHAHQLAALMVADQPLGAMVSRSADGDAVVPTLRILGGVAMRGSSGQGKNNRGGRSALQKLVQHVSERNPGCLTVDGPRGPRGRVHKGIGELARQSKAVVLATTVIPRRRWILRKAWDRMQIPLPFTTLELHFSEPIRYRNGESLEFYRRRIHRALSQLEQVTDPQESGFSEPPPSRHDDEAEAAWRRRAG